jgi:hypothetical protein
MSSLVLRKVALCRDLTGKYAVAPAFGRVLPQQRPFRLRRKGPVLWAALALLVLAADFVLAYLAWLTVDLIVG